MSEPETQADLVKRLRDEMQNVKAEPLVPTAAEIATPAIEPQPPRESIDVAGLPVDHFWRDEAERLQGMSGEGSQE